MEMNKVRLTIAGTEYVIATEDEVEYTEQLGAALDEKLTTLLKENQRLSVTQGAVLCALEYADLAKKQEENAEHLRSQIQAYLEDAAKARTDAEIMRRESERLNRELATLRNRNGG